MFNWFKKREPLALPFETDMHCHITPGLDDGSPDVETSVSLLAHMESWGLKRVIPTPHVTEDTFENTPATVDPQFELLKGEADKAGIGVHLCPPSAEYRLDNFFIESLGKGLVRPLGSDYLLVENSFANEPWEMDQLIFDLKLKGFRPVLAHPERYLYYHGNPERYKKFAATGLLMQTNVLSLAGYYGKHVKQVAHWMLDNGLIGFLGTDLHGFRHVEAIEQYLKSSDFARVSKALHGRLLNDTI